MLRHRLLAIAGLLALASAQPLAAQVQSWQYRWYWGAKGGFINYNLPTVGNVNVAQAGGEWLITARRSALYVGYSTTFIQRGDNFPMTTGGTTVPVLFDAMQRIQIAILVFPTNGPLQPYAGGGFVIETLANAVVNSATPTAAQTRFVSEHSSGGFALAMIGAQLRIGKAALFGQAQFSPQGRDFLLAASSASFEFGLRYAFLGSREDDVTARH